MTPTPRALASGALLALVLLGGAGPASAAAAPAAACDAYSGTCTTAPATTPPTSAAPTVGGQGGSGAGEEGATDVGGAGEADQLPFTGGDVLLTLALALGAVGAGVVVLRAGRKCSGENA